MVEKIFDGIAAEDTLSSAGMYLTKQQQSLWEKTFMPSEDCMRQMIHLEDLFEILEKEGYDTKIGVPICLEPPSDMKKKIAEGKKDQLWSAFLHRHPESGVPILEIKRGKGDLYRIFMAWNVSGGFCQPLIEEEPKKGNNKVGHFILRAYKGALETIIVKDPLGRSHVTILGGSLTRGADVPDNAQILGFFYTNFQRITGKPVVVYFEELAGYPIIDNSKFGPAPEGGWNLENMPEGFRVLMHHDDIILNSHDARTLACLAMYFRTQQVGNSEALIKALSAIGKFIDVPSGNIFDSIKISPKDQKKYEELYRP